jgi:hypothetical protein
VTHLIIELIRAYDKLTHTEFFREGKVDGEIKRCILCSKVGGEGVPADGHLKSCGEEWTHSQSFDKKGGDGGIEGQWG